MEFGLNDTKHYFQRLKQNCHDPRVWQAAEELLAGARAHEALARAHLRYVIADAKQLAVIKKILVVAYNGRYASEADAQAQSFGEVDSDEHVTTLAAVDTDASGHELLLGTLRLVRERLELFDFFALPEGEQWRYQREQLTPYELERFAFHPVLEICRQPDWRPEIVRGLIDLAKQQLDPARSWLVCTMSPHVAQFITGAGIAVEPIADARAVDTPTMRYQREHWPKYFAEIGAYEIH